MATEDDGTDEVDGSVTATVDAGAGYRVGGASSATVDVSDDDLPTVELVLTPATVAEIGRRGDDRRERGAFGGDGAGGAGGRHGVHGDGDRGGGGAGAERVRTR